jgi:hypothetical protein
MINALNTATSGMLATSQVFDQEAAKIAKAGANAVEQVASKSIVSPTPKDEIVKAVVQMTRAETNYNANAKVAETVSKLAGETLDILA